MIARYGIQQCIPTVRPGALWTLRGTLYVGHHIAKNTSAIYRLTIAILVVLQRRYINLTHDIATEDLSEISKIAATEVPNQCSIAILSATF